MTAISSSSLSEAESFWAAIAEKPVSEIHPENELIVEGPHEDGTYKRINTHKKIKDVQTEMLNTCNGSEKLAAERFVTPPKHVLDLGAGTGPNSLPMACNGAAVKAIDISKEMLLKYSDKCREFGCPSSRVRLIRADITDDTKMPSYGKDFDLALAVDILPYIKPYQLRSTMRKIHEALKDRGMLIGTLFLKDPGASSSAAVHMLSQLGAHFFEGGLSFIVEFLIHSGFAPQTIEQRKEEGGYRFSAVKLSS